MASTRTTGNVKRDMMSGLVTEMDERLPKDGLRSLCELKLENKDYVALSRWVREKLTRKTIRLSGWKAGAIVFNLITEAARREAVGHRLWPIIAQKFSPEARHFLFPNNHPSPELKRLIIRAAQELRLRHVFDDDEAQSWYITTHLQFGFTQHGFQSHLPEWLCGQNPPESVSRLIAGSLASDSFRDLWQALRFYRRDWITEEHLRSIIRDNPWVLPEWENDLVRLSREKLHLLDVQDEGEDSDLPPIQIVDSPRCQWHFSADPTFTCQVAELEPLGLMSSHYNLVVGDAVATTLFRQPDGSYVADSTEITLSPLAPQVVLKLIDAEGILHCTQLIELWDPAAEVNVFEMPSGKWIDAKHTSMAVNKDYLPILQPDLHLYPTSNAWTRLGGKTPRFVALLPSPWDSNETYVAMSDGSVLWRPPVDEDTGERQEPSVLKDVTVQVSSRQPSIKIGQRVSPVVRGLPDGCTLAFARFGGRPLSFDSDTWALQPIEVSPEDARSGFGFSLGVRITAKSSGETIAQIRRPLEVDVIGTARLDVEGWHPLQSGSILTSRVCREKAFQVYLPKQASEQKAALFEGPRFLRWLGQRAAPLGHVYGMGAPLFVRRQRYNCPSELITIAKGVSNGGIVDRVDVDEGNGDACQLLLAGSLCPSEHHSIVIWPGADTSEPVFVDHTNIETWDNGRRWSVACPSSCINKWSVVAVAYKGCWLGGAPVRDAIDLFGLLEGCLENRLLVASLIRWFQLPVLLRDRPKGEPEFATFAQTYPEAVLAGYLTSGGLPHVLTHDDGFDRRQIEASQLRELFLAWCPTSEQAQAIVEALATNENDPLGDVVLQLLVDLPLLTGHIMRRWLQMTGAPEGRPVPFYMQVLRHHPKLRSELTVRDEEGKPLETLEEILQAVTRKMPVGQRAQADEYFVEHAIVEPAIRTLHNHPLTQDEKSNLAVALQIAPFRQYLALRVLDEIEKGLQDR